MGFKEMFSIVFCVGMTIFTLGWVGFGVWWIRKVSNDYTPPRVMKLN